MNKKYEMFKENESDTFYRIKALRDFGNVMKAGDIGGYVENESNLSHEGDCWVFGNARVYDNAVVSGDARVFGNALVYGYARVSGDALVYGDALVSGDAEVYDNAVVSGSAEVFGNARVSGNALVSGNEVLGCALVSGDARVYNNTIIGEVSGSRDNIHAHDEADTATTTPSDSLSFNVRDGKVDVTELVDTLKKLKINFKINLI